MGVVTPYFFYLGLFRSSIVGFVFAALGGVYFGIALVRRPGWRKKSIAADR
jgi:hypothetical protein